MTTPEKLMQERVVDDVQVGDNIMGKGKGVPTRSMEHEHVQSAIDDGDVQTGDVPDAIDAEGVPKVSGDCPLDPEVAVDKDGYPTIFGDIIMGEVAVDDNGYPTIFGDILMGEGKEAMQEDDSLPSIRPINPNGRARKLQVQGVAKARLEEDLANGVAPTVKKRLKSKQQVKTQSLKAKMIQQWHKSEEDPQEAEASTEPHTKRGSTRAKCKPTEPKEDEPKAEGDAQAQQVRTAGKRGTKNANVVILSAFGSSNTSTGRFDIQGKCRLADGSIKNMGILGFSEPEPFGAKVWRALLNKINAESGEHTKGEMLRLRDELIASCKAGLPC